MKKFWKKCRRVFLKKKKLKEGVAADGPDVHTETTPQGSTDPLRSNQEEEILHELTCPICFNLFNNPVLLPCLHSLCEACADSLRSHFHNYRCPVCMKSIGIASLRKNFPLRNMVEIFKRRPVTGSENRIDQDLENFPSDSETQRNRIERFYTDTQTNNLQAQDAGAIPQRLPHQMSLTVLLMIVKRNLHRGINIVLKSFMVLIGLFMTIIFHQIVIQMLHRGVNFVKMCFIVYSHIVFGLLCIILFPFVFLFEKFRNKLLEPFRQLGLYNRWRRI